MVGRYQQNYGDSNIAIEAEEQSRILSQSISRVQEASHYMRQAMERDDLPATLEKARAILTELGDVKYSHQQHQQQGGVIDPDPPTTTAPIMLSPKNYYELHTLAVQELPNLEEFFLSLFGQQIYSPSQLYEIVQYCPRAVPRLYLQICVASAWIRAGTEITALAPSSAMDKKWILQDLKEAVRCVQCPIRGLFLRYYLLQALRDKLPDRTTTQVPEEESITAVLPEPALKPDITHITNVDVKEEDPSYMANNPNLGDLLHNPSSSGGFLNDDEDIHHKMENIDINTTDTIPTPNTTIPPNTHTTSINTTNSATVKDSYEFILSNLIEMNKLWVRIQYMPGDQRSKEARKKRERERNELRVLVGTNIVRLSELDEVTSTVYGTVILPKILDQIVACRDPLAQAYLMDCMIQVFPDEFHIQTLEVILGVCPRLREKVNIRTILQGIMDRFSTYYADELLLNDEEDTEGVKTSVMLDTFEMFEDCIASVLEAKAAKVTAREVIRLESSLLDFSLKCYPGRMDHVNKCLGVCASGLRAVAPNIAAEAGRPMPIQLDGIAVSELEKLLSLPLESLALRVLELDHYSELLTFLPINNRKLVAVGMLKAVESSGATPMDSTQIEQLFSIIKPLLYEDRTDSGMGLASNNPSENLSNNTDFVQHQTLIGKLLHTLYHEDTDLHYDMLCVARKHLPLNDRICSSYTAPPLIYAALKLLSRIRLIEFPPVPSLVQNFEDDGEEVQNDNIADFGNKIAGSNESETIAEHEENIEETIGMVTKPNNADKIEDYIDESITYLEKEDEGEHAVNKEDETKEGHDGSSIDKEIRENTEELEGEKVDSLNVIQEKEADVKHKEELKKIADEETDVAMLKADLFNLSPEESPVFSKNINCRKIFLFIQKTLTVLKMSCPNLCFSLTLHAAATADNCATVASQHGENKEDLNPITYEFMTQALLLYESEISDSKCQPQAITSIVGTLLSFRSLETSEYEALITKTTQYAARLLKKPDQCKMVLLCSHLFFIGEKDGAYQNPQRALECLQRALKIADACTATSPTNLQLFVDILEQYIYFYERNNPIITDRFISGLIALVNEHIGNIGAQSASITSAKSQFYKIIEYVEEKKTQTNSAKRFQLIVC